MKINYDPKTGGLKFELSEKDLSDAFHISQMMESPGWKVLVQYLAVARESLIASIKDSTRSRAKRELCPERAATLRGFDEFLAIPQRIIDRADEAIEARKQKKGGQNGQFNGE